MYGRIGSAHLLQSRIDEAIVWYEKARDANPARDIHHAQLAAAFGLKGDTERAAAGLPDAQKLSGNDRFSSIAHLTAFGNFGEPQIYALVESTFFAGLRKAGCRKHEWMLYAALTCGDRLIPLSEGEVAPIVDSVA